MFELEQAISGWRREMIAAGFKSPAALDELESHLREDIERQMHSGSGAQAAFEAAVRRLGGVNRLKAEFARANGFPGFLGNDRSTRINRMLAVLWFAGCLMSLNTCVGAFDEPRFRTGSPNTAFILMDALAIVLYVLGTAGSILLFRGSPWGRSIVRMLALLLLIACAAQILDFRMPGGWRVWCGVCALFSLVTIWLLHRPENTNENTNAASV